MGHEGVGVVGVYCDASGCDRWVCGLCERGGAEVEGEYTVSADLGDGGECIWGVGEGGRVGAEVRGDVFPYANGSGAGVGGCHGQ